MAFPKEHASCMGKQTCGSEALAQVHLRVAKLRGLRLKTEQLHGYWAEERRKAENDAVLWRFYLPRTVTQLYCIFSKILIDDTTLYLWNLF